MCNQCRKQAFAWAKLRCQILLMPTDTRRQHFRQTSQHGQRRTAEADLKAKARHHSDIQELPPEPCRRIQLEHQRGLARARWKRWAKSNRDRERERKRRERADKKQAVAHWREWLAENRFYRAAYMRARRRLLKIQPPMDEKKLAAVCRRIALRESKARGER